METRSFFLFVSALLPSLALAEFALRSSLTSINAANKDRLVIDCVISGNPTMSTVNEIKILRVTPDGTPQNLAKVSSSKIQQLEQGFQVTGEIKSGVRDSYIELVWNAATEGEYGSYRCDVIGLDKWNDYVVEKSNVIVLQEDPVITTQKDFADLKAELDFFRNETQTELDSVNALLKEIQDAIDILKVSPQTVPDYDTIKSTFDDMASAVAADVFAAVANEVANTPCSSLVNCGDDVADNVDQAPNTDGKAQSTTVVHVQPTEITEVASASPVEVTWPAGNFALLKSKSGCPGDNWETGYVGLHTESVDLNEDEVSEPNHLAEPVSKVDMFYNSMLYMHFCVRNSETGPSGQWPKGSYCISRVNGVCPPGFGSGSIDIDEEDEGHQGEKSGVVADMIYYCCRNDGPAGSAIALPTSNPFYLYRFGGKCQAVKGMNVASEYMIFDSENSDNEDKYENEFHPDGHLRNVLIELCYYSNY